VELINAKEPTISKLSDIELKGKTEEFRQRIREKLTVYSLQLTEQELKNIEEKTLNEILPEAFAVVREAAKRSIDMRHFDVQLIGGVVLHQGKIAEMATGEGKTLVATLSSYLNALTGKGVHIVTVNDYLAKRDREWMGPIYESLGLSVGVIQHDMEPHQRQAAYNCDITYGTNNEFGFDYLRDNMVIRKEDRVQRTLHYAIVDEVDSILIDEARTPLIISGPAEESTEKYYVAERIAKQLKGRRITEKEEVEAKYKGEDLTKGYDYLADEKTHAISLTEEGEPKAANLWNIDNLHEIETMEYRHHTIQALRAKEFFNCDVDYVLKDRQVIIVDEFTGRMMPGRRWSDGLHQAIEAKENLKIAEENQTLATITFQNYFRMYEKLAGMTGTAATEQAEFKHIYNLEVVVIPTNRPLIRTNYPDAIYKTFKEKFNAVVEEIVQLHQKGRPVLVGTISIEKSERLSELLKRKGITHSVLNAKYHDMEAQIVAQAGRLNAVTIATNMAGRGTDILLGGNAEYIAKNLLKQREINPWDENYHQEYQNLLERFKREVGEEHKKVVQGGLHIVGTERHEARRIDNQLRGRAGRQGDPGSSRFYLSLEDDLMRIFGSDRIATIMDKLGMEEGQVIEHPLVTKAIETAQKRVEAHNFEIRKQLLEYDNVMNKQREVIYAQRRMVLEGEDLKEHIFEMVDDILKEALDIYLPIGSAPDEWNLEGLKGWMRSNFNLQPSVSSLENKNREEIKDTLYKQITEAYQTKEGAIGKETMRQLESMLILRIIDSKWKDHLYAMDNLREGIGLRAYGQRDPLVEYQHEAFNMFSDMIERIKEEIVQMLFKVQVLHEERLTGVFQSLPQELIHQELSPLKSAPSIQPFPQTIEPAPTKISVQTYKREGRKIGRNEPCPCGKIDARTGKPLKYKKCCGR
jgi:preprotein translocase subunit SecA